MSSLVLDGAAGSLVTGAVVCLRSALPSFPQ